MTQSDASWPVAVSNIEGRHLAQAIRIRDTHSLIADEPAPLGQDTGAAPHEILLSALGACTAMTLRLYAERKKWDIGDVTVRLRMSFEKVEGGEGRRAVIERLIESNRALTAEQQARLTEIAEKCPVHRTLMGEKTIDTRIAAPVAEI